MSDEKKTEEKDANEAQTRLDFADEKDKADFGDDYENPVVYV